jgi:RNA polymerase sigma factor (sigma-70 family)
MKANKKSFRNQSKIVMKQAEFVSLVMPFKDKVFRLAKRLLVSREEAEDATQEILLKLWNNKAKIEEYKNVEAFSMTMTKNFCLDRLKSRQAQNLKIVHSNYTDGNASLQRQLEVRDSMDWVSRIIEDLPEQQKIIVQLRDIEQYEYAEISKMLDMNETAIRVALSRARKTIREKLTNTHRYGIT